MNKDLIKMIEKTGNEVNGTYELVGQHRFTVARTKDIIRQYNLPEQVLNEFVEAIAQFKVANIGPYDTGKYHMLIPALKEAVSSIATDCEESRRCVIDFPRGHCFQSIQFLYRDNTINVVCFMRSCDVIKNFPYDLWLCSFLADMFKKHFEEITGKSPYPFNKIHMYFGSLHLYKKDLENVL